MYLSLILFPPLFQQLAWSTACATFVLPWQQQFDGYFRRVKGLPLEGMGGVEKNNISSGRVEIQLWEKSVCKRSTEKGFVKKLFTKEFVPLKEFVCVVALK